ncbi:N-acetylmuramoyl-L-alanine amidase [Mogibacterium sp. NSJ-24]|jgi:N-acetylmuramoyl-L-alanine amidase|uniref:N-acetylmuramoyl-L-alanine amidase n=1 Tax=Lentihominibacter hominis TaxID=2763645 RepID=A0A926E8M4_9FIRM|nr:N-acetylmuramoyl-L-alanine amidase [Lentihominibacter hominis]MBC8567636.1 N-acetylmuramoyl-L-alanine amidase [Lentihominibacter hominis]
MKSKGIYILATFVLVCTVLCIPGRNEMASYVWKKAEKPVVVLDPGHGGMDGGAQSSDGTSEKDINLSIAEQVKKQLEGEGVKVIMTRYKDEGLYDESQEGTIRSLKTQDMKERKRIIDDSKADLTVSIHLNSFTQDSSVKGAQVFYPSYGSEEAVEASKKAAEIIQSKFNNEINTDKKRTELGKGDVFLLKNITGPIVIVECGFLSNPEDAGNLKNKKFQIKISENLSDCICEYLSSR